MKGYTVSHMTRRYSDQLYCSKCNKAWDVNDDVPTCERAVTPMIIQTVTVDEGPVEITKDMWDDLKKAFQK